RGRGREGGGRVADVVARHLLRDDGLVRHVEHRMRDRGGRKRRLATDVAPGVAAAMAELNRRLGAAAVDLVHEAGEAGQGTGVEDAELPPATPPPPPARTHLTRATPHT